MPLDRSAGTDLLKNSLASGFAGFLQPCLFNPLDVLRLRFQTARDVDCSLADFTKRILASEGTIRGLYLPGLAVNIAAVSLTQGLRMGVYPDVRDVITSSFEVMPLSGESSGGDSGNGGGSKKGPVAMAVAGLLSGAFGYFACAPLWLVKTRWQVAAQVRAEAHKDLERRLAAATSSSSAEAAEREAFAAAVRRAEALPALSVPSRFWLGAGVIVFRGACLTAGQMLGYDGCKTVVAANNNALLEDGPALHVTAAVVAGFSAATTSAPPDVIMTRYQSAPPGRFRNVGHCVRAMWDEGGGSPRVFFRGWTASFMRLAPTFIFGITIYEQSRRVLGLPYLK